MEALEEINPRLQADGGDIDLIAVENGAIKVKLKGACAGCPMYAMTISVRSRTLLEEQNPRHRTRRSPAAYHQSRNSRGKTGFNSSFAGL